MILSHGVAVGYPLIAPPARRSLGHSGDAGASAVSDNSRAVFDLQNDIVYKLQ
jgi:hypothetical protein